jgi:microcystin-dependent protein
MANNPELLKMPLARDGQKSTIPETTDASTGLFSQQYGWQSINSLPPQAGGKAVKREDFNGAFNLLGGIAYYAQKGFTFKWSAEQDYYAGCVVIDDTDGLRYECIADVTANNTAPSADATHWQTFSAGTDLDAWFRQASTVYAVGDMRCSESLPYGWYLECTTAGTTGSSDITIPSPLDVGDTVTDGTVVWTIRKIANGDGFAIGDIKQIAHNGTIQDGWLECDGRAVSRTMFPDLFDAIGTTYGAGDGSTTFNLPNYSDGKFPEGGTVAGTVKQAGLPNITGSVDVQVRESTSTGTGLKNANGSFSITTNRSLPCANAASYNGENNILNFNASLSNPIYGASNTVQPYSCTVRYVIKAYDGVTPTPAEADISEMLTELTGKADRDLGNLSADGENHFLENDFTIIYPNGGSEASPANITNNTSYVESNPFPGYYVKCIPEVLINGVWGDPRWGQTTETIGRIFGVNAGQLDDGSILVKGGNQQLTNSWTGPIFNFTVSEYTTLPCRVKVWKIGKIPT